MAVVAFLTFFRKKDNKQQAKKKLLTLSNEDIANRARARGWTDKQSEKQLLTNNSNNNNIYVFLKPQQSASGRVNGGTIFRFRNDRYK